MHIPVFGGQGPQGRIGNFMRVFRLFKILSVVIRFGEPIRLTTYGPEAAEDDLLVTRLAEGVRTVIQEMLSGMLASRRSIWLG